MGIVYNSSAYQTRNEAVGHVDASGVVYADMYVESRGGAIGHIDADGIIYDTPYAETAQSAIGHVDASGVIYNHRSWETRNEAIGHIDGGGVVYDDRAWETRQTAVGFVEDTDNLRYAGGAAYLLLLREGAAGRNTADPSTTATASDPATRRPSKGVIWGLVILGAFALVAIYGLFNADFGGFFLSLLAWPGSVACLISVIFAVLYAFRSVGTPAFRTAKARGYLNNVLLWGLFGAAICFVTGLIPLALHSRTPIGFRFLYLLISTLTCTLCTAWAAAWAMDDPDEKWRIDGALSPLNALKKKFSK